MCAIKRYLRSLHQHLIDFTRNRKLANYLIVCALLCLQFLPFSAGMSVSGVVFDYTVGAWRVNFQYNVSDASDASDESAANAIFIPQTCDRTRNTEADCEAVDYLQSISILTCHNLLSEMRNSHWQNSVVETDDTLCDPGASLSHKQELYASSNDFLSVTTPLSVLVAFERSKLQTFTGQEYSDLMTPETMNLPLRLLKVTFIDSGTTVQIHVLEMMLMLHAPVDYTAELVVENACVGRGLQTPRNGMLVAVHLQHNIIACVARCSWRHVPVPWNAAALPAAGTTEPAVVDLGKCVALPQQFTAIIMHVELEFPGVVSARLLPQSELDKVDALAQGLQNNSANVTASTVVCRVPGSFTAGLEFSFLLQKFANEHDDASYTLETRHRAGGGQDVVDEHLHAECLFITTDLLEPNTAEATFVGSLQAYKANKQQENAITLGEAQVASVSRRAQTKVTVPPRINLDLQRLSLVALQVVVVLATATALTGRTA